MVLLNYINYNLLYNKIQSGYDINNRNSIFNFIKEENINNYTEYLKNFNKNISSSIIIHDNIDFKNFKLNNYQTKLIKWMSNFEKKIRNNKNNIYLLDNNIVEIKNIYFNTKLNRFYLQEPKRINYKYKGGAIISNIGCGKTYGCSLLTHLFPCNKNKSNKILYDTIDGTINKGYIQTNINLIITNCKNCNSWISNLRKIGVKRSCILHISNNSILSDVNYKTLTNYKYIIISVTQLGVLYNKYVKNDLLKTGLDNIRIEQLRDNNIMYLNYPYLHILKYNRIVIDNMHTLYTLSKLKREFYINLYSILNSNYKWILSSYIHDVNHIIKILVECDVEYDVEYNVELLKFASKNLFYIDNNTVSKVKLEEEVLHNTFFNDESINYDYNNVDMNITDLDMSMIKSFKSTEYITFNNFPSINDIKKYIMDDIKNTHIKLKKKTDKLEAKKLCNITIINALNTELFDSTKFINKNNEIDIRINDFKSCTKDYENRQKFIGTLNEDEIKSCIICCNTYTTKDNILITKCGHHFCMKCVSHLSCKFKQSFNCSNCRVKLTRDDVYSVCNAPHIYCSKVITLLKFLKNKSDSNIIILSQWSDLLGQIKNILTANDIKYSTSLRSNKIRVINTNNIFSGVHLKNIDIIISMEKFLHVNGDAYDISTYIYGILDITIRKTIRMIYIKTLNSHEVDL
jgi:hypothetical protein